MLGRWFAWQTLAFVPVFPEAQGLFPGHSFQGWGVGCSRKPWLCFPRASGNCSGKTNGDFLSLSSFAFVSSQLLPLNLPFPRGFCYPHTHSSSLLPLYLPFPSLQPQSMLMKRTARLKHLFSVSLPGPSLTPSPQ